MPHIARDFPQSPRHQRNILRFTLCYSGKAVSCIFNWLDETSTKEQSTLLEKTSKQKRWFSVYHLKKLQT
jgi:hypothetical protein